MPPETLDSLDADSLKPLVLRLLEQNASMLARIDTLLARIAELEAKAAKPPKSPRNSSLPPSRGQKANTEPPGPKPPRKGRPGVFRALSADPDITVECRAAACTCGHVLDPADLAEVFAYDHIDLPRIEPVVTRVHLHKGQCPRCRARVTATPPPGMAPGSPFGPAITATVNYLHATQMIAYARLVEVMRGLFGVSMSEGAIARMLARTARPMAASGAAIGEIVKLSPVIASDETSARIAGRTHWEWTFVAPKAVRHIIAPTRGKVVPIAFLGEARPEVWTSDRYAAQAGHAPRHQYCLAHLIRDAQYAIDAGDTVFAPAFKAFLKKACAIGQRRPDLADATLAIYARRLVAELDRLLDLAPTEPNGRHLLHAMIVDGRERLLVFMTRRDVEPTSNDPERTLRPSVVRRKINGGFRTGWGATLHADTRSVVETARRAGCHALDAIRAALAGCPIIDTG